jgi:hypothetical protein
MSDMVENGSNWRRLAVAPDSSHPEFEAMCALASAGALNAEEEKRLAEHLSRCNRCRRAMAQYEAMAASVLPLLDEESIRGADKHSGSWSWSLEEAEATLFSRLEKEEENAAEIQGLKPEPSPPPASEVKPGMVISETLWRHMWWQYAAGLALVVALGFALYRVGVRRGTELVIRSVQPAQEAALAVPQSAATLSFRKPVPSPHSKNLDEIGELRAEIARQSAEIAQLKTSREEAATDHNARTAEADAFSRERADLERQLSATQSNLQDLQRRLDASQSQSAANTVEVADFEARVTQLNDELQQREQEVAQERDLLDRDRDIRELMSARDLYIAEVYDVAKNGETEKPFGRVFYTQGKSLIFYAYDLDQQPGVKNAGAFQAWGRRGPDTGQAVNLGILFEDNASKKRWVVKSHDSKTLADIDAVFVTVEPNGGSVHPSGKPLLFAYLRNNPNHP